MSSKLLNLTEFLSSTLLFRTVDKEVLTLLATRFTVSAIPAGEVFICAGEPGDSMFILQTGKLAVLLKDTAGREVVVSNLHPGDSVGELALLTGAVRSATVKTVEESTLWQLTRHDFAQAANADPQLRMVIEKVILEHLQRANLRSVLYGNRLFATIDQTVLHDLEQALTLVTLRCGKTLLREGDTSDALYVVVDGRLRVVTASEEGAETTLDEVGNGQTVGEMGLLTGEPRSATVYAVRDTLLGRLNVADFYLLLQKYPKDLTRLFSSRIITDLLDKARGTERKRKALNTITVVAIGPDVPVAKFAEQLSRKLRRHGPVLHVDDTLTDEALGQIGIAEAPLASAADLRLSYWFGEQEASHEYVIYASPHRLTQDAGMTAWTARCLQRADHILYLAWADTWSESTLLDCAAAARQELVLLHPLHCQVPHGTNQWLDALNVDGHHHVRWPGDDDIGRLARVITHRGIALVLGGGGARGFTHIGVIRALQEANVPIDLIGGTSAGAGVGALFARGYDYQKVAALMLETGKRKNIVDYTLPFTSLFAGKRYTELMKSYFGTMQIEDAWQRFFCISTDLVHAAEVVHTRGPMWKYIRASCGVPVLLPPLGEGDRLLVDGGMMNNYPTDVMRSMSGCGLIIGVDVAPESANSTEYHAPASLSGWHILNGKVNPFVEPVQVMNILETVGQLTKLSNAERYLIQQRQTDVAIRPPVGQYKMMDFSYVQEIIDIGYRTAQPIIADWLASGANNEF